MITLKNNDTVSHVWAGQFLTVSESIEVQESFKKSLLMDSYFLEDLESGKAVILDTNNNELSFEIGLHLLQNTVKISQTPFQFIGVIGSNVPSLEIINGAVFGYLFEVGNKFFIHQHLENILSDNVNLRLYLAINNSTANRFIKFRISILTTNGNEDKVINTEDQIIDFASFEVPTTPFIIFNNSNQLPSSLFESEESEVFLSIERIELESGKIDPTNNPILLRSDLVYYSRTDI